MVWWEPKESIFHSSQSMKKRPHNWCENQAPIRNTACMHACCTVRWELAATTRASLIYSCRCTISLEKSLGSVIRNITISPRHQMYTCTVKGEHKFSLFAMVEAGVKRPWGPRKGKSTCKEKVGLPFNAQLIKLWCILLSCVFISFPPNPSLTMPGLPVQLSSS